MPVANMSESGHSRDPKPHFAVRGALIANSVDWNAFSAE